MPKVNVYLNAVLERRVRELAIPLSPVCQRALEREVAWAVTRDKPSRRRLVDVLLKELPRSPDHEDGDQLELFGRFHGVTWAHEHARLFELEEIDGLVDDTDWIAPPHHSLHDYAAQKDRDLFAPPFYGQPWTVGLLAGAQDYYRQVVETLEPIPGAKEAR